MNETPKTIQIFLPSGNPQGIRVAEITTRIVKVFEVPRSLLADFIAMEESGQVGVYFLVGQATDEEPPKVYIGQTGGVGARIQTHSGERDFWDRALVLISRAQSLTQTHALFLEWHCLQAVKAAKRYTLQNSNAGSRPHAPEPLAADCMDIFQTGKILLSTLGYPLFDPLRAPSSASATEETLYCTVAGIDGRGVYTPEGFVVLAGSTGRLGNVPSMEGSADARMRGRLMDSGVMAAQGDRVVFTRDHLFKSPSTAAVALLGSSANGWDVWKNDAGTTLHQLKRVPAEGGA